MPAELGALDSAPLSKDGPDNPRKLTAEPPDHTRGLGGGSLKSDAGDRGGGVPDNQIGLTKEEPPAPGCAAGSKPGAAKFSAG